MTRVWPGCILGQAPGNTFFTWDFTEASEETSDAVLLVLYHQEEKRPREGRHLPKASELARMPRVGHHHV